MLLYIGVPQKFPASPKLDCDFIFGQPNVYLSSKVKLIQSVSEIRTSLTWFNFFMVVLGLNNFLMLPSLLLKNDAFFKNGQKWLKNNHLALKV